MAQVDPRFAVRTRFLTRILTVAHGRTCKQVAARFEEERPHLQPLPASLFPCYQEARRNVSRDSFVEVQRAFYEAPPEYIGRQVWVRWG